MELGELIKSVAEERNISVSQLAEMIHCNRQNVYKIFKKGNIDTALLGLISKALNHNFFEDISKDPSLSGADDSDAFREITNRMAVSQFVEVMPRVLNKLGKKSVICFGGKFDIPDNIPLPDYCLSAYDVAFSLDSLLSEKPNCNFGNAIDIKRIQCKELNIDFDFWQFKISPTRMINLKLDYKIEEEWEKVMKYIFSNYEKLISLR